MIVLIVVSFHSVDVGYYGLDVNYIIQQSLFLLFLSGRVCVVDLAKVYPEGRYFSGLGHSFIQYPKVCIFSPLIYSLYYCQH